MNASYFNDDYFPVPRRGLTSIEAVEFMRREFPEISQWTCWRPNYAMHRALAMITGKGERAAGKIGDWSWVRLPCRYPELYLWDGQDTDPERGDNWVGVLKITGAVGVEFRLFSFLNSMGVIGQWFLASTPDVGLLKRFNQEVFEHFRRSDQLTIQVHGRGRDIGLIADTDEAIFLPSGLREELEQQVCNFYESADRYRQLRLRHRRGLLLVGAPGVGKSLLLRHLARLCHRRYRAATLMLCINNATSAHEISILFDSAVAQAPALVIIEDIDALNEARVGRAHLLGCLDGVEAREGLLVIATSNHPERLDPALVHRPSRFDRVFTLPLPDETLRREYIRWALPGVSEELQSRIVQQSDGWSYAYLNELRASIGLRMLTRGESAPLAESVVEALEQLSAQFQAGRKNHVLPVGQGFVGFGAAQ